MREAIQDKVMSCWLVLLACLAHDPLQLSCMVEAACATLMLHEQIEQCMPSCRPAASSRRRP
jgi:hypothetical protein